jgi:hypothetical protein
VDDVWRIRNVRIARSHAFATRSTPGKRSLFVQQCPRSDAIFGYIIYGGKFTP